MLREYSIHLIDHLLLVLLESRRIPTPIFKVGEDFQYSLTELLDILNLFQVFNAVVMVLLQDGGVGLFGGALVGGRWLYAVELVDSVLDGEGKEFDDVVQIVKF